MHARDQGPDPSDLRPISAAADRRKVRADRHPSSEGALRDHPDADHRASGVRGRPRADRPLLAGRQLPVGRADLPPRQPAAPGPARGRARQAAAARPLGHHAGTEPALRPPQPGDQEPGPERPLRDRSGARRSRPGGERVPRGHLQRGLRPDHPRRGRDALAVPAVLLPRRHPQPRRARDARLDPRGRRARLRPGARLRCRVRQPRPAGGLRGRGRRGRDRTAGRELALQQVPQPGHRRRGAADPAPQRLQDRQPDRARADPRGRAARPDAGLRLRAFPGQRLRPDGRAPRAGRDPGHCAGPDRGHPAGVPRRPFRQRPRQHRASAAALADDHPADAEGLDRSRRGRRPARGGHLPLPPGAARCYPDQPGAPRPARDVAAQLPPGRAVRRHRSADARAGGAGSGRRPADERQPARQRRPAAARPHDARLPRLRRHGGAAGDHRERGNEGDGRLPARHHHRQPRPVPGDGSRRDRVQPAAAGLRGHRPGLGRRAAVRATTTWPPTAG